MSYHEEAPDLIAVVEHNEFTELMEKQLAKFTKELMQTKSILSGE